MLKKEILFQELESAELFSSDFWFTMGLLFGGLALAV